MNQDQNNPLFGLTVDLNSRSILTEIAKWARFLAILGFIICGLVVLGSIFIAAGLNSFSNSYSYYDDNPFRAAPSYGFGFLVFFYIIIALIYFFPTLYLYRFAVRMKRALAANDQDTFNDSLSNLRGTFRFVGTLMIIIISLWILGLLFGVLAATSI